MLALSTFKGSDHAGRVYHLFLLMFPERKKYYEMSSFVETKGLELVKSFPSEFVEYPSETYPPRRADLMLSRAVLIYIQIVLDLLIYLRG